MLTMQQSSIALTGELLYKVTGISGKVELEEEETPGVAIDNARRALLEALGQERRDRILAILYIIRQDSIGIVRQASIHIWKALVQSESALTGSEIWIPVGWLGYAERRRHTSDDSRDLACPHADPHVFIGKRRGGTASGKPKAGHLDSNSFRRLHVPSASCAGRMVNGSLARSSRSCRRLSRRRIPDRGRAPAWLLPMSCGCLLGLQVLWLTFKVRRQQGRVVRLRRPDHLGHSQGSGRFRVLGARSSRTDVRYSPALHGSAGGGSDHPDIARGYAQPGRSERDGLAGSQGSDERECHDTT